MIKRGVDAREQGMYCAALWPATPRVLYCLGDGYAMELLRPDPRAPTLLLEIEALLEKHVWSRQVAPEQRDEEWPARLRERTGLDAPRWAEPAPHELCVTHGDCTASNALRSAAGQLVMADPLVPRPHAARCREADMGRMLQSALGWETALFGDPPVAWQMPLFWQDLPVRRRALFWCAATARRISVGERERDSRPRVLQWCEMTAQMCLDATRL